MTEPRIGIIGTGNMGRIHARVLGDMRLLVGVTDLNQEAAQRIGETYRVPAFNDFHKMIEELSLNAVIISTPTSTHASIAEEILKQHDSVKYLLIEKPLASNLDAAKRVADALNKRGAKAIVSHSEIYNPIVNRAISLIKEGAIGIPNTVIHDRRGFVQPARIPSLGDVFEDLGVHDFDIMTRISTGPATLYAQCHKVEDICNAGTVLVKFDSGAEHTFHLSRQYASRARHMDVSGTKGTLLLDLFAQIIKVKDLDQEPQADERTIRLPERGATIKVYGEPVREVLRNFIGMIENGEDPIVSIDDGLGALRVVEAARKSAQESKPVRIDIPSRE